MGANMSTKLILMSAMNVDTELKQAVEAQAREKEISVDKLLSDEAHAAELAKRYLWNIRKAIRTFARTRQ